MKRKTFVSSLVLGFLIATFTPQAIEAKEVINEGDPSAVQEIVQNTEPEPENESLVQEASKKRNWVKYGSRYSGNNTAKKLTVGSIAVTVGAITRVPASVKWVTNIANLFYQTGSKKVYYSAQAYKDKNSPKLRPTYKVNYTFYSNKAHTKKIGSKSVIRSAT
ncbi:hypothetical protein NGC87_01545 [Staphylococcus pseudoxylosus]|uniref:hypothetical protein n=2 Tax=Staphylococcus pseudoxylosus TaxID=2282419 RepID=UPI000D1D5A2F|nr:hypothetical protein [Staphylococcus pseudoxylosus]PTI58239.1 hypothetical protein BU103_06120 [Staphylococcus xylosus]MDW8798713.1 hypothetical protein [Staphylococcus pseudoxylosus]MEB6035918.1 hypothetical protein [Staphylococcus pseudoxylosus]MEB6059830.1 hypothetical protein [Staphylococcus pseudoxylosus]MEB7752275.1 hypothetical protein [Staphylococcus pseudoxylosus]